MYFDIVHMSKRSRLRSDFASKFSFSAVTFGSTYAVGKVFQTHFASGGTLLNFDPVKARELYKTEFQEGAQMAPESTPA